MCIEQSTLVVSLYKTTSLQIFSSAGSFFLLKGPTPLKVNMEPGKWTPLSKPEIPALLKKKRHFFSGSKQPFVSFGCSEHQRFLVSVGSKQQKTHEELLEAVEFRTHRHVQIFRQLQARRGEFQTWRWGVFCEGWIFVLFRKEVKMLRLTINTIKTNLEVFFFCNFKCPLNSERDHSFGT